MSLVLALELFWVPGKEHTKTQKILFHLFYFMFSDSSFAVCVCVRVSEREVPGKVVGGEGIEGR